MIKIKYTDYFLEQQLTKKKYTRNEKICKNLITILLYPRLENVLTFTLELWSINPFIKSVITFSFNKGDSINYRKYLTDYHLFHFIYDFMNEKLKFRLLTNKFNYYD